MGLLIHCDLERILFVCVAVLLLLFGGFALLLVFLVCACII